LVYAAIFSYDGVDGNANAGEEYENLHGEYQYHPYLGEEEEVEGDQGDVAESEVEKKVV
jgi:hypothetical protein